MAEIDWIVISFASGMWATIGVYHLCRWWQRRKEARRG